MTSSGNGSDDEDPSEEMIYPTVFPGWDKSLAKDEYDLSTSKELDGCFFFFLFQCSSYFATYIFCDNWMLFSSTVPSEKSLLQLEKSYEVHIDGTNISSTTT